MGNLFSNVDQTFQELKWIYLNIPPPPPPTRRLNPFLLPKLFSFVPPKTKLNRLRLVHGDFHSACFEKAAWKNVTSLSFVAIRHNPKNPFVANLDDRNPKKMHKIELPLEYASEAELEEFEEIIEMLPPIKSFQFELNSESDTKDQFQMAILRKHLSSVRYWDNKFDFRNCHWIQSFIKQANYDSFVLPLINLLINVQPRITVKYVELDEDRPSETALKLMRKILQLNIHKLYVIVNSYKLHTAPENWFPYELFVGKSVRELALNCSNDLCLANATYLISVLKSGSLKGLRLVCLELVRQVQSFAQYYESIKPEQLESIEALQFDYVQQADNIHELIMSKTPKLKCVKFNDEISEDRIARLIINFWRRHRPKDNQELEIRLPNVPLDYEEFQKKLQECLDMQSNLFEYKIDRLSQGVYRIVIKSDGNKFICKLNRNRNEVCDWHGFGDPTD